MTINCLQRSRERQLSADQKEAASVDHDWEAGCLTAEDLAGAAAVRCQFETAMLSDTDMPQLPQWMRLFEGEILTSFHEQIHHFIYFKIYLITNIIEVLNWEITTAITIDNHC